MANFLQHRSVSSLLTLPFFVCLFLLFPLRFHSGAELASALECWSCADPCECLHSPRVEECAPHTKCYTIYSLTPGSHVLRKGCSEDCVDLVELRHKENCRMCAHGSMCNDEASLSVGRWAEKCNPEAPSTTASRRRNHRNGGSSVTIQEPVQGTATPYQIGSAGAAHRIGGGVGDRGWPPPQEPEASNSQGIQVHSLSPYSPYSTGGGKMRGESGIGTLWDGHSRNYAQREQQQKQPIPPQQQQQMQELVPMGYDGRIKEEDGADLTHSRLPSRNEPADSQQPPSWPGAQPLPQPQVPYYHQSHHHGIHPHEHHPSMQHQQQHWNTARQPLPPLQPVMPPPPPQYLAPEGPTAHQPKPHQMGYGVGNGGGVYYNGASSSSFYWPMLQWVLTQKLLAITLISSLWLLMYSGVATTMADA